MLEDEQTGTVLEIAELQNGDVVLREAGGRGEPLVRIRFAGEVRDMLGDDVVNVAEAMIEAATDRLSGEEEETEEETVYEVSPPVLH